MVGVEPKDGLSSCFDLYSLKDLLMNFEIIIIIFYNYYIYFQMKI